MCGIAGYLSKHDDPQPVGRIMLDMLTSYNAGRPGIGFNFGVGETNVDHGFTYFEVETYND